MARSWWWSAVRFAASLALAAACGPAATAAEPAASQAISGVYTIDPYHTQPVFSWRHFDISTVQGRFDKTTGKLVLDVEHRKASVDVTIQVASISTGVPLLDQRLKSPAFLDAAKYPVITFKSNDFEFVGDQLKSVKGNLTIHGVTRPVVLAVRSAVCKRNRNPTMTLPACGADMELTIKRSDYGVGYFAPLVSDELQIHIGVEAIKGEAGIEGQFGGAKPKPK
jgi:polyisoprenoid-binding protein YceI